MPSLGDGKIASSEYDIMLRHVGAVRAAASPADIQGRDALALLLVWGRASPIP
jgi:hypothetical protein